MTEVHEHRRGNASTAFAMRYASKAVNPFHGLARELLSRWSSETIAPVVGITSAAHKSGVTSIAANLGVSAAEIVQRPALLIDCNANAPDLLASFALPTSCGVHEVIAGEQSLSDCIYPTRIQNLQVLGPGRATFERGTADETQGWKHLLRDASTRFGIVIVDFPPVPELLSEVMSLQEIDRLLLVVEAERTRRQAVVRAKSQLQRVGIELSGIVLNKRRKHIPGWIYRRI